jgi:hypothetical protein
MATIYPDQITNATASTGPSASAKSLTIEYKLDDVDGQDIQEVLRNALEDTRLPASGEESNTFDGYVLASKTARAIGRRQVAVTCEWRPNQITQGGSIGGVGSGNPEVDVESQEPSETGPPKVSLSCNLVGVTTNYDVNNELILATYGGQTKVAEVSFNVPVMVWRFERLEPTNPIQKQQVYVGKINSAQWYGSPPFTFLCRSIDGEPVALANGFTAWRVSYEFERAAEGNWIPNVLYVDPETGEPPTDVVPTPVLLYPETDFNLLNLFIPI